MQAKISTKRLSLFQHRLITGLMYSVSGFDVTPCAPNFKLSNHSLMIRFTDSTSLEELSEPVLALPEEGFQFYNETELQHLADTNTDITSIFRIHTNIIFGQTLCVSLLHWRVLWVILPKEKIMLWQRSNLISYSYSSKVYRYLYI